MRGSYSMGQPTQAGPPAASVGPLGTIPPGQEARFPLLLAMGSPDAVDCLVTWTDAPGNARETRATVRT